MKSYFQRLKSLNNLRKIFDFGTLKNAAKAELFLKIEEKPLDSARGRPEKVLVLAPCPDDDVFGAGGVIALHSRSQDEILILYLCDGSRGTKTGIRDLSLIPKRRKEGEAAAKIIGANELIFWRYADGKLSAGRTTLKAMENVLKDFRPNLVYLPHFLDNNPTHLATNEIFVKAGKLLKDFNPQVYGYEIWVPTFINRLVNVSSVIETKKEAIRCHQSQLKSRNYLEAILGLNQYRGEVMGVGKYAEGFLALPFSLYAELFERMI